MTNTLRLETRWTPASDGVAPAYELKLTNNGPAPISNFRLCVSGPGWIDGAAAIEGGRFVSGLSNHAEIAPPEDFVLAPGKAWTLVVSGMGHPLKHWSDGATSAYLAFSDDSTLPIAVNPTLATGQNVPLRKGAERYKVPGPGKSPVPISVVPWPERVAVSGSRTAPAGLAPEGTGEAAVEAIAAFASLTTALFPAEGVARPAAEGGHAVRLLEHAELAPEAYSITFGDEIVIRGATHAGLLFGLITLGQIWRGARLYPETFAFPAGGTIVDAPTYRWRGSHLDVARQFYSTAEVSRFIELLAWNKMNRLHWHLSDDEAWRVEIEAWPALTQVGAWRGHGLPIPPLLGSGPEPQGGYYSKAAVRDIVERAGRLGVDVVPEIDMPGHCFALLQAIPELRDPDQHGEYASVQGFPNNCINPALEKTYEVLGTIFDELIELFPSKIIHVGADEVPLGAWSGSPLALAKLRELGGEAMAVAHARRLNVITNEHGADDIEGSGAASLQALFLKRVQALLTARGAKTGGWEEAAHGDVLEKENLYLVGWRNVEVCASLAGRGYDIVVSPGQVYYLDMAQSREWSEPGASWAGNSGVEETYNFDPAAGWSETQKQHLLGVQACIWSEPMTDRAVFDRLVFPRLSAIAESGWTASHNKSWPRFLALCGLMPILYGYWAD
jgi:hexosaminidase